MKEEYLHYLWKMKRIPFHLMKLQNGETFQIISSGIHNENNDGPDFYDAKVEIDGIVWAGPVELHVKSSDWHLHQHQFDRSYDNVILHVVYDDNRPVYQNGRLLPCLELKSIIDPIHVANYFKIKESQFSTIMCAQQLCSMDSIYLTSEIDRALISRVERKLKEIRHTETCEDAEILYRLIAQAFGAKVNKLPFVELTVRLPYKKLQFMSKENKKHAIETTSGLFYPSSVSELLMEERFIRNKVLHSAGSVNSKSWKFSGVRPQGFPTVRIQQFAEFLNYFDLETISIEISVKELLSMVNKSIEAINKNLHKYLKISRALKDSIIINAIVPFVVWLAKKNGRGDISEGAIELMRLLPAETNSITLKWKEIGVKIKNAQESQGLIELYNEHCLKKKCLSCAVGNKLLNR